MTQYQKRTDISTITPTDSTEFSGFGTDGKWVRYLGSGLKTWLSGFFAKSSDITSALAGKANTSHSHIQGDITGLTVALAGKVNSITVSSFTPSFLNAGTATFDMLSGRSVNIDNKLVWFSLQARVTNKGTASGQFALNAPVTTTNTGFEQPIAGSVVAWGGNPFTGGKGLPIVWNNLIYFISNMGTGSLQWSSIAVNDSKTMPIYNLKLFVQFVPLTTHI